MFGRLISAILILIAIYSVARVVEHVGQRNDPPITCQLVGGQWSLWNGWRCN